MNENTRLLLNRIRHLGYIAAPWITDITIYCKKYGLWFKSHKRDGIGKDISYKYGEGKISYYANDSKEDAAAFDQTIIIGGTTDSLKNDEIAPELKLFIDDRSWVFGGSTDFTPLLLADIYDENGINTVGSGIGREMEAVVDEGTEFEQIIVLNDFFEPELNSYQRGTINYRFDELEAGKHTVRLKV